MKKFCLILFLNSIIFISLAFGFKASSSNNYNTLTELIYSDTGANNQNIIHKMNLLSLKSKQQVHQKKVKNQQINANDQKIANKDQEQEQQDEDTPDGGLIEEIVGEKDQKNEKLLTEVFSVVANYLFKNGKGAFFQFRNDTIANSTENETQN